MRPLNNTKRTKDKPMTEAPITETQQPPQEKQPEQTATAQPPTVKLDPPGDKTAYPIAAFRWKEVNIDGHRVLQQAYRVEQSGKIIGIMWSDVPVEPFLTPVAK
jgi:hypothetical protein